MGHRGRDVNGVRELRLCVTASDYDQALRFYRDVLGLEEREAFLVARTGA